MNRPKKNLFRLLIVLALCVPCLAGCKRYVPMGGSVSFKDGEKLSSGTVYFESGNTSGFGIINKDGTYEMGMIKPGEGVPPGEYTVYLGSPVHSSTKQGDGKRAPSLSTTPLVDPRYTSSQTSDLKVVVTPEKKIYDIVVPRNPDLPK